MTHGPEAVMVVPSVFDRFSPTYPLVGVAIIGLVVARYQLAKRFAWMGVIVPAIYCVFVVPFIVRQGFPGIVDGALLLLGLGVLLSYWRKAQEASRCELENNGADQC